MNLLLSAVVGVLFGTGVYLLMRRTMVRMLIGLALLSNGANLLIFSSVGLTKGNPPLVPLGAERPTSPTADPTAQALILTAIVISFAVTSFALTLAYQTYKAVGRENLELLTETEQE